MILLLTAMMVVVCVAILRSGIRPPTTNVAKIRRVRYTFFMPMVRKKFFRLDNVTHLLYNYYINY